MHHSLFFRVTTILFAACASLAADSFPQNLPSLRNPVWTSKDNLRDPSVFKTANGYHLFYSRFSGELKDWKKPENWAIASVFTKDYQFNQ